MPDDKSKPPQPPERPRPLTPDPGKPQTHGQDRPPKTKTMDRPNDGERR